MAVLHNATRDRAENPYDDFKPESIRPQLLPKPYRNVVAEVADFCGPKLVP